MKNLICAALLILFSATAFSQTVKVSGDAKTGIYWQEVQEEGKPVADDSNALRMESHDGDPNGNRLRINLDYDNGKNFGFRGRIDWTNWSSTTHSTDGTRINLQPAWGYAFGYLNFFEDQMTVSVGKLGGSPWGTGGPEMWRELEQNTNGGGMRMEWKPSFIPGRLNLGFVLNYYNDDRDQGNQDLEITLVDILRESVLGISYTHDWGLIRFAYRLDSNVDAVQGNKDGDDRGKGEDELLYRLEERLLTKYLAGLQIWALGSLRGLFDVYNEDIRYYRNWFFIQYEPPELGPLSTPFTAQVRLGYDYISQRGEFYVKPSFYWHFFNKLVSAGASFSYRQDYGKKVWEGSPYKEIEVEPKIQLNFASSYIAFVYNWKKEYIQENYVDRGGKDPTKQTRYINLRFCIYY